MLAKSEVIRAALNLVQEKIKSVQSNLDELTDSLNNNIKSSAGDKHETSRAMIHLEQEKLGKQLTILLNNRQALNKAGENDNSERVEFGSLIKTDQGLYFISSGIGKVQVGDQMVFCVSPTTPLANLLIGKTCGDRISLNNIEHKIEHIY